jgi:hypothetical protein
LKLRYGNVKLILLSLILMAAGWCALMLAPTPSYSSPPGEFVHALPFDYNVSSDSPEWNYTLQRSDYSAFPTRIGITNVETNGASVRIYIQRQDNVTVLSVSDVNRISNGSIVIPGAEGLRITIAREDGDSNGSLVIQIMEIIPPPDFDSFSIRVSYTWTIVILLAIAIAASWKIVSIRTSRKSIRPGWIALLVLVSIALVYPYSAGTMSGFFTPRPQTETVRAGSSILSLNESHPSSVIDIGVDGQESNHTFRVHSIDDANMRYHIELKGANDEVVLILDHENSSIPWEILGASDGQDYTLVLERLNIDVDVSLTFEVTRIVIKPSVDPEPGTIMAWAGVGTLFLAISGSLFVETREGKGKLDDGVPSV